MIEHPAHLLHEHSTALWAEEHNAAQVKGPDGALPKTASGMSRERSGHGHWWPMAAIAPAILISAFDMTTLNVALPALTKAMGASTSDLQWIIDSYTIALAGLLLFAQGVADRFGRKGTYMAGLALFASASTAAAFCTTPTELILARTVMGVGAAFLLSPTLAMIAVIYTPAERPKAVAIWVVCGGIGTALGPVLSGVLIDTFGWGAVFLINVPVVITVLVISALKLPTSRKPGDVHLDVAGAALSVVGLSVLLYAIIEGPATGWLAPATIIPLLFGIAITAGFFVWELRSPEPMFDPRVFKLPAVIAGSTSLFCIYLALLGMLFLLPQYLQFVEEYSAAATGVLMLPFGLAFIIAAQIGPRLSKRIKAGTVSFIGLALIVGGLVTLALIDGSKSAAAVLIGTLLLGTGIGAAIGPSTTVVVNALPITKAGDGSSVNMLMRQAGAAFGIAILGSIFASAYAATIAPALRGLKEAQVEAISRSVQGAESVARTLPAGAKSAILKAADEAFLAAARDGFLTAAAICLLGAVIVWITLHGKKASAPA